MGLNLVYIIKRKNGTPVSLCKRGESASQLPLERPVQNAGQQRFQLALRTQPAAGAGHLPGLAGYQGAKGDGGGGGRVARARGG